MNIQLTDTYRITSDKLNIILEEKYEKRDGKGKSANFTGQFDYKPVGYFRKLNHLADWLVNMEIYEADITELYDVVNTIEKLRNDIANTLIDKIILINGQIKKES